MKDSLGERMKELYEVSSQTTLVGRMPVIIRLDGKAFHTFTRKCEKPFDGKLHNTMCLTMEFLCRNIQTAVFGYTQSDEISILLHPYKKLDTCSWYGNNVQKMTSVSASFATGYFNEIYDWQKLLDDNGELTLRNPTLNGDFFIPTPIIDKLAFFDSRVFNIPEAEVANYFHWRQKDAERNSIQMLAQSLYSHKELDKKNSSDLQEMCFQKGYNWNDLDTWKKRGSAVYKKRQEHLYGIEGTNKLYPYSAPTYGWFIDQDIPIFSQDRNFIEKHLEVEQE